MAAPASATLRHAAKPHWRVGPFSFSVAVARSFVIRQNDLDLARLRLDFLRDTRVRLYSVMAHANWSFLRRRRPQTFSKRSPPRIDRLDSAISYALQLPGRAILVAAQVAAAFLIAPALTLAALGVEAPPRLARRGGRWATSLRLWRNAFDRVSRLFSPNSRISRGLEDHQDLRR